MNEIKMNEKKTNKKKIKSNKRYIRHVLSLCIVYAALTLLVPMLYGWDCMPGEDKKARIKASKTHDSTTFLARYLRRSFQLAEKHLFDAHFILKHAEAIKLSGSQQEKIESIMMNYQESAIRISAEIKILELRFASDIRSGGPDKMDKKKMENHIRLISKQKTDWVVNYINYLLDLRQVLQAGQLKTLEHLSEESQKKRLERRRPSPGKGHSSSKNSAL